MTIPASSAGSSSSVSSQNSQADRREQFLAERERFYVRVLDEGLQRTQLEELRGRVLGLAQSARDALPADVAAQLVPAWNLLLSRWDPRETAAASDMLEILIDEQPGSSSGPAPLAEALMALDAVFVSQPVVEDCLRDAISASLAGRDWWVASAQEDQAALAQIAQVSMERRALNQSVALALAALIQARESVVCACPQIEANALRALLQQLAKIWHTEQALLGSGRFMPDPAAGGQDIARMLARVAFEERQRSGQSAALAAVEMLERASTQPAVGAVLRELAQQERAYANQQSRLTVLNQIEHQLREPLRAKREQRISAGIQSLASELGNRFAAMFQHLPPQVGRDDMNRALHQVLGRWIESARGFQWRLSMPSVSSATGLVDVVDALREEASTPGLELALEHFCDEMLAPHNDGAVERIRHTLHTLRLIVLEGIHLQRDRLVSAFARVVAESGEALPLATLADYGAMPLVRALLDADDREPAAQLPSLLLHEARHYSSMRQDITRHEGSLAQWAHGRRSEIFSTIDALSQANGPETREAVLDTVGRAVALVRALFDHAGDTSVFQLQVAVSRQVLRHGQRVPFGVTQAMGVWQSSQIEPRVVEATQVAQQAVDWLLTDVEEAAWGLLRQHLF